MDITHATPFVQAAEGFESKLNYRSDLARGINIAATFALIGLGVAFQGFSLTDYFLLENWDYLALYIFFAPLLSNIAQEVMLQGTDILFEEAKGVPGLISNFSLSLIEFIYIVTQGLGNATSVAVGAVLSFFTLLPFGMLYLMY